MWSRISSSRKPNGARTEIGAAVHDGFWWGRDARSAQTFEFGSLFLLVLREGNRRAAALVGPSREPLRGELRSPLTGRRAGSGTATEIWGRVAVLNFAND
jgi:hypothetical protein